jgi:hypothetical protein
MIHLPTTIWDIWLQEVDLDALNTTKTWISRFRRERGAKFHEIGGES